MPPPAGLLLVILVAAGAPLSVRAQSVPELLRTRVEQVHEGKLTVIAGTRLMQPDAVAHFFESRGFSPAWDPPAVEQIRQSIQEIHRDGLTPADYHFAAIDALRTSSRPSVVRDVDLQILLTDALAGLIDHVRYGKVRPGELDRRWNVNPREGAPPLERLLLEVVGADATSAAIESLKPSHFIYRGLKEALAVHRAAAAGGGWPRVPSGPSLKPGVSDPRIADVRKRLAASGDLQASSSGPSYDDDLAAAVRRFQGRHRLTTDGVIGRATVAAMNVTAEARVDQIRVNLERSRWVLAGVQALGDSFVVVNLPAFDVRLIRGGKSIWEARAVVGRIGRQTPAFRADMRYLVFNPDWIVPPTILAQDVLRPMRRGENAIARKKLTILDRQGHLVSPAAIDWTRATPPTFPYTLRQPPGPDNALGRVKFVFPNEHTVFLHDTPSRDLFRADQRTFSSGCIRIERPLELAELLLQGQGDWNRAKIEQVVEAGQTETVFLERQVPVLIVYWTVNVTPSGERRYARDVYNLDRAVLRALDAVSVRGLRREE